MAKVIETSNPREVWVTMSMRTVLVVFLYGASVGAISYLMHLVFERFIFDPILCRESAAIVRCESASAISAGTAMVVGSFIGLTLLVRERIYRPILAIIGLTVSLWGVFMLVAQLPAVLALVVVSLIFAAAYVLFSWLVQPKSLEISIASVVLATILARLALG